MRNSGAVRKLSWRSPKTEVRASPIHGRGLFATAPIEKDEIVAVKGGHIVTRQQWLERHEDLDGAEIQIAEDLFIAPVSADDREGSMLYTNHSCLPNLGLSGSITFVAMRPIVSGEELTHDWCMTDSDDSVVICQCGEAGCRRQITGGDWRLPELQRRYAGYFSTYLERKIASLRR